MTVNKLSLPSKENAVQEKVNEIIDAIPTDTSDLTNDAGYITNSSLPIDFTGADGISAGANGLVPAPSAADNNKFLKGDGTWADISGGGTATDVRINGTSITSNNVADILTEGQYSPLNKIATMATIPDTTNLANKDLSNLSSTGEAKFVKGTRQQIYPVVATYRSGSSWYRIYADGWCEQGGHATATSAATEYQVQLSKTMSDTNYTLTITSDLSSMSSGDYYVAYTTKAVGSFKVKVRPVNFDWKVEGLLATNQYTAYTIYGVK